MATTYTETDNIGLDLYGDNDPADLRDGYNSSMRKIDSAVKANADAITTKANSTDVYTKTEVDSSQSAQDATIALKANSTDVYTKTEIDSSQSAQDTIVAERTSVSVKEYGAKGDGVTDDSQAFNDAIQAIKTTLAKNNDHYPALLVPAGVYLISNTITLDSRISIKSLGDVTFVSDTQTLFNVKHINTYTDRRTSGSIFDGTNGIIEMTTKDGIETGQTAIAFSDSTSPHYMGLKNIRNVSIAYFDTGIDIAANDFYLTNFYNVMIHFCQKYCVRIHGTNNNSGENVTFNQCVFGNSKNTVFDIASGWEITFNNCSFDYNENVITLSGTYNDITLNKSHFEGNSGYVFNDNGINTDATAFNTITANDCEYMATTYPLANTTNSPYLRLNYINSYERASKNKDMTTMKLVEDNVVLDGYSLKRSDVNLEPTPPETYNIFRNTFKYMSEPSSPTSTPTQIKDGSNLLKYNVAGNCTIQMIPDETYGNIVKITNITSNVSITTNTTQNITGGRYAGRIVYRCTKASLPVGIVLQVTDKNGVTSRLNVNTNNQYFGNQKHYRDNNLINQKVVAQSIYGAQIPYDTTKVAVEIGVFNSGNIEDNEIYIYDAIVWKCQ